MLSYIAAALLRGLLIAYGAWQDKNFELRYTDIDYDVFSDGAELVLSGRCPYHRATYRYTPLLALLLTPNAFLHRHFGKLLFAVADLIVGYQLRSLLLRRRVPKRIAERCSHVWLFHPLSINVSTRGSMESIVLVFLLGSLHALLSHRTAAAAALLAAAVHMKPYPAIYIPAYLVCLDSSYAVIDNLSAPTLSDTKSTSRAVSTARLLFLLSFGAISLGLCALCYAWCGAPFLQQALLYHVSRADARHNFSAYFYAFYLAAPGSTLSAALSAAAFVPQVLLLLVSARKLGRDLPFCLFVQTLIFVAFNKVCTAQYFVWYHALLPLVVPSSAAFRLSQRYRLVVVVSAWLLTCALWLVCAHQIEFRAKAWFLPLWLAGLAFFAANVALACAAITWHRPVPLFRMGRVARQACFYGVGLDSSHGE